MRGGRKIGVPGRLAVEVGMDVDEAGGNDATRRVYFLRCVPRAVAHGADDTAFEPDVAGEWQASRAVDNCAAAYDEIHRCRPVIATCQSAQSATAEAVGPVQPASSIAPGVK